MSIEIFGNKVPEFRPRITILQLHLFENACDNRCSYCHNIRFVNPPIYRYVRLKHCFKHLCCFWNLCRSHHPVELKIKRIMKLPVVFHFFSQNLSLTHGLCVPLNCQHLANIHGVECTLVRRVVFFLMRKCY